MEIPDKIKICGKTYKVDIRNNRGIKDGADRGASASNWSQIIWIDDDQHIETQEESLLHEIIELILKEVDFEYIHSMVSTLSLILYQVLKENNFLKD